MQPLSKIYTTAPLYTRKWNAPQSRTYAGVTVPDTALISSTIEFVRSVSEPYLFNHVMRSWLFAVLLAGEKAEPYDAEVLAVSTLLHDIGLTRVAIGPLRFEVEGANAARTFVLDHGISEQRAQLIWDSIALNSTPSICLHKQTEAALCVKGVGLDWGGWDYNSIPQATMASILAAFPRLGMKHFFAHAVCDIVEARPESTYDNFARDFGQRFVPGYQSPSTVDVLLDSPFEE